MKTTCCTTRTTRSFRAPTCQRLSLVYLGPKTPATTDDEVNRVIADLQRWAAERDHQPRANADERATKATAAEAR